MTLFSFRAELFFCYHHKAALKLSVLYKALYTVRSENIHNASLFIHFVMLQSYSKMD